MNHYEMSSGSLSQSIAKPVEGACRCGCGGVMQEETLSGMTHFRGETSRFEMYRYRCSVCRQVFLHYEPIARHNEKTARG